MAIGQAGQAGNEELIPFSEASLQGVGWETLNSLAYKFQGGDPNPTAPPTQLAQGYSQEEIDRMTRGIPTQEVEQMKKAGVGPWEGQGDFYSASSQRL